MSLVCDPFLFFGPERDRLISFYSLDVVGYGAYREVIVPDPGWLSIVVTIGFSWTSVYSSVVLGMVCPLAVLVETGYGWRRGGRRGGRSCCCRGVGVLSWACTVSIGVQVLPSFYGSW